MKRDRKTALRDRKTALRDYKRQSKPYFNQDCPFDGIFFSLDKIPLKKTAIY